MSNFDPISNFPTFLPATIFSKNVTKETVEALKSAEKVTRLKAGFFLSVRYVNEAAYYSACTLSSAFQCPINTLAFLIAISVPKTSHLAELAGGLFLKTEGLLTLITNIFKVIVCAATVFLVIPAALLTPGAFTSFYDFCNRPARKNDDKKLEEGTLDTKGETAVSEGALMGDVRPLSESEGIDPDVRRVFTRMIAQIQKPAKAAALGLSITPSVLMEGPPGTGKTYLAASFAKELQRLNPDKIVNFSTFEIGELFSKYYSQTAINIIRYTDEMVALCRKKNTIVVIFLDELDTFTTNRENSEDNGSTSVAMNLNAIMNLFVRIKAADGFILAATNQRGKLDEALLRSGRIDQWVTVPKPSADQLLAILSQALEPIAPAYICPEIKPATPQKLAPLAGLLDGLSISDIKELVRRATTKVLVEDADKITVKLLRTTLEEYREERIGKNKTSSRIDTNRRATTRTASKGTNDMDDDFVLAMRNALKAQNLPSNRIYLQALEQIIEKRGLHEEWQDALDGSLSD